MPSERGPYRSAHRSRGARTVSRSAPSAVTTTSSSCTIVFPGAYRQMEPEAVAEAADIVPEEPLECSTASIVTPC